MIRKVEKLPPRSVGFRTVGGRTGTKESRFTASSTPGERRNEVSEKHEQFGVKRGGHVSVAAVSYASSARSTTPPRQSSLEPRPSLGPNSQWGARLLSGPFFPSRQMPEGYVKSLVYADKPQTLDHLEDNIRRVIADIRSQMLEKVIENWTSRLDYIRASRGSPMPEIIFKM
ncbi:hypothetical protein TNCV_5076621 [Trichonephila clavipes]|uniref:Uncharacterized protein n=1 Tax=Trichonephila clavipes TaxID=2585209 RepID=A0A8X6RYM5_TRICX|nr:hypothetical protein TNCV_5076621 [Trichonephila clavipes]